MELEHQGKWVQWEYKAKDKRFPISNKELWETAKLTH